MKYACASCLVAIVVVISLPGPWVLLQSGNADGIRAVSETFADSRVYHLLRNSIVVAIGAGVMAAVFGGIMGIASVYWPRRLRPSLFAIATLPLLVPPYVFATAWVDLLGTNGTTARVMNTAAGQRWATPDPYNIVGVVFVLGLVYAPIAMWCTVFGLRSTDGRMAHPLRLLTGEWTIIYSIMMPKLLRYIAVGAVLVSLMAVLEMSVPALLQVNVYPVEIYTEFNLSYDAAAAAARAIPLAVLGGLAIGVFRHLTRSLPSAGTDIQPTWRPAVVSKAMGASSLICTLPIVAITTLVPLALLAYRSLPLKTYREALITAGEEFGLSVVVGLSTSLLVIALTIAAYHILSRRMYVACTAMALFTFLLSGPITGIGLIFLWNRPGIAGALYDGPLIIIIACAARCLGPVMVAVMAVFDAMPAAYRDAADLFGVSLWRRMVHVSVPAVWPGLLVVLIFAFAWSFGELAATVLVCPPGYTMLSVRLHTLLHYGPTHLTAALSILSALVPIVGALALYGLVLRKGTARYA